MFDVLVYLFENYYQTETYPDQDTLERKLHAAGFENDDIQDALDWLNILTDLPKEGLPESLDRTTVLPRIFCRRSSQVVVGKPGVHRLS